MDEHSMYHYPTAIEEREIVLLELRDEGCGMSSEMPVAADDVAADVRRRTVWPAGCVGPVGPV
jgi:hypothetical protein